MLGCSGQPGTARVFKKVAPAAGGRQPADDPGHDVLLVAAQGSKGIPSPGRQHDRHDARILHSPRPRDVLPALATVNMFGGVAAKVNGQMFAGLFGRGAVVKLAPADRQAALSLDGATTFDPMGNGRVMHDMVLLPESVMDDQAGLRDWLRKALDYTATLPAKRKPAAQEAAAAPKNRAAAKPASRRRA